MNGMRIRATAVLALWVIVAVVASTVVTCVPDSMSAPESQMTSCLGTSQACLATVAVDCCTHPQPSLTTAKAELLKAPARHVSPWLTAIAPVVVMPTALSIIKTESPPGLAGTLSHPTYILLSTLRI